MHACVRERGFSHTLLQAPTPVNMQFTCLSSQMAANMTYYMARLQAHYCASFLQKPTRLQRFFTSRR